MNVLVLTADYPPIEGGIGTLALHTSRELAAAGHAVTVIAPRVKDTADFDSTEPVSVVRYPGYGLGRFRFVPMLLVSLRHVVSAEMVFGINIAYGGVIAYLCRKPYVAFAYAYEFLKFERNPVASWLLRRVYARARLVVAISSFTYEKLLGFGVPPENVRRIFPGAAPARRCAKTEIAALMEKFQLDGKRVVLSVGRFVKRKGHDTLVKALPTIVQEYPDTTMVLVGRGPKMEATRELAEELGVGGNIRMTGHLPQTEVDALYQACELFALPTGEDLYGQVEGFGLVFSEAHAYGKPVVAGRSGGVVDAVQDGVSGILVDTVEPHQLSEAILTLLRDPELAKHLGANGKKRVEQELNWTAFTGSILDALEGRQ